MALPAATALPDVEALTQWVTSGGTAATGVRADLLAWALATATEQVLEACDDPFTVDPDRFDVDTYPWAMHTAVLIVAARLYKRRVSPEGVAGFGELGAVRISATDPDVGPLLGRWLKLDGFAGATTTATVAPEYTIDGGDADTTGDDIDAGGA